MMSPDYTARTTMPEDHRAPTPAGFTPVLEAVNLRKYFPFRQLRPAAARHVVNASEVMSLALCPGRALALVGESGSGKPTGARMLARFYDLTAGSIRFRGQPVKGSSRSSLLAYRRHVQLIFQDPFSSLNPVHGVRYHLSRPLRIHGHAHSRAQETEQVLALLNRVNLSPADQFIGKFPHQLSGGQRQRVAIARALAGQPQIFLPHPPGPMLDASIPLDVVNLLLRVKDHE